MNSQLQHSSPGAQADRSSSRVRRLLLLGPLSAPLMLATYIGAAVGLPYAATDAINFCLWIVVVSLLASLLLAWGSRLMGLYRRDPFGTPRHSPQLQGALAPAIALILAWWLLPRLNVQHPLWAYLVTLVGAITIGVLVCTVIAGRRARLVSSSPFFLAEPHHRRASGRHGAPAWLQPIASLLFVIGILSLVWVVLEGAPVFIWVAIGCITAALVLALIGVWLGLHRA